MLYSCKRWTAFEETGIQASINSIQKAMLTPLGYEMVRHPRCPIRPKIGKF